MGKTDIWPTIQAERKSLANDLGSLDQDQWAKTSLCTQWTVWDVLAHMTATAKITPPVFFGKMIASGFSFDTVQGKGVAAERGDAPADVLARFEAVESSRKHPPGPVDTWLGETIV